MTIYRPELTNLGRTPDLPLKITHSKHIASDSVDFLAEGNKITGMGRKIGADAVIRSGTFSEALLGALDKVSAYQQFSSNLNQAALLDPDSVNVEDVSVAMAQARLSLDITRNVLNRVVQGWRDLINTR
ncbi:MAG: flagellar hook-basal body complex protein FliE [Treponema sp.]|jgi:flagellar hook-basal body complex protein FliE|nr:flagellar hook-basal body complex protein FliE [Treponema sp.]